MSVQSCGMKSTERTTSKATPCRTHIGTVTPPIDASKPKTTQHKVVRFLIFLSIRLDCDGHSFYLAALSLRNPRQIRPDEP